MSGKSSPTPKRFIRRACELGAKEATVCIQKATYDTMDIPKLLDPLGGLTKFVHKGETVVLKVNLLNASSPETAVVTDPRLVGKVAKAILDLGAHPIIADSPSGPFSKRRLRKVYEASGLLAISNELGITLNYDTGTTTISIPHGREITITPLCNYILNADKIISLPKIKTHAQMIMTLATKNMYGAVPGLTKAKYHALHAKKSAFADMLLDVYTIATPDLVIMDGIIGMQGEGPGTAGDPVNLGVLIAGVDPVSIDLSVCQILQIEPIGIPVLRQAKIRKLWPRHICYPLLAPVDVAYSGFILPKTADYLLTGIKTPSKIPVITSKCVSCGQCEEICPRDAITISPGHNAIDYSRCIRCYCCQEICPERAIILENHEKKNLIRYD